jgi:hypothetical protein
MVTSQPLYCYDQAYRFSHLLGLSNEWRTFWNDALD